MDPELLERFQEEVLTQCDYIALHYANAGIAFDRKQVAALWSSLEPMISAGANVAKLLWGPGGRLADERAPLRETLDVADDSPLHEVTFRNHFEHIDNRIDRWWTESTLPRAILDMNVMPEAMLQRWQKVSIFRNYDPQTGNVYFWSDAFAIHELASAAADLAVKARAALSVDLQQPPNSVTYARTFTGGDVRISDLLNGEHQLSGFTFDSCRLIGPAVLITVEGGYYQDNEITDEMLWQIEREKSYLGSVGLVNCTIVRCSFVNVGWAKPPPGE